MSFKFFRKYQRIMLWVIVVITVCTFSIFSVTSTMQTCFTKPKQPIAQFTSKYGDVVEVYERLRRYCTSQIRTKAMLTGASKVNPQEIMTYLILLHEAEKAGIRVSDGEISDWLSMNFSFLKSEADYRQVLAKLGFTSTKKFEESLREIILVEKLKHFIQLNDDQVLSEDLFDDFKIENEEFKLAYVSFPYDRYTEEIPADSVVEEDLITWYEELPEGGSEVREYFSEPEKFEFDVAYIDILEADFEDYKAIVEEAGIVVEDRDITMHYERSKDRFKIEPVEETPIEDPSVEDPPVEDPPVEDPPVEDPPVEDPPVEDPPVEGQDEGEKKDAGDEEQEGEKSDKVDQFQPYDALSEEIKEQIANEIKLIKLVDTANKEWAEYARLKGIIGKSAEELEAERKAKETGSGEGDDTEDKGEETGGGGPRIAQEENEQESGEGGGTAEEEANQDVEEEEAEEERPPEVFFEDLLSKYRLSRDRVEGPVSIDDLPGLDRYGSEMLKNRMRFLKVNNAVYIEPDTENPYLPFFAKVTTLVDRRKKVIEEVRDVAVVQFLKKLRKEKAAAEAEAFVLAMKEKARLLPEVQNVVEQWEKDALNIAQKRIDGEVEITEEKAEEIRKEEVDRIQGEVDGLLAGHLFEFFDDEAAAFKLGIDMIDYFRKSKIRDPEYLQQEKTAETYIMSNPMVLALGAGGVSDPLSDMQADSYHVVRVLDRRFPEPSAMTAEDYETFRRREEQMRMMRKRYPQYYPATDEVDPFSFDRIVDEYKLVYYETEEEDTPEEEQTPGGMEEGVQKKAEEEKE